MDYEKIAAAVVLAMKVADLNRFLVVCALVSDLYCPGYIPRQSLAKDSNLTRTAARYKIGTAKMTAIVRTELSKKKHEAKQKVKAAKKSGPATVSGRKKPDWGFEWQLGAFFCKAPIDWDLADC